MQVEAEAMNFEAIRALYPDQWVLIGNPELDDSNTLGSIASKLLGGVELFAGKDKREVGYRTKELRKGYESVTCVYTGDIPQNRKWLLWASTLLHDFPTIACLKCALMIFSRITF